MITVPYGIALLMRKPVIASRELTCNELWLIPMIWRRVCSALQRLFGSHRWVIRFLGHLL